MSEIQRLMQRRLTAGLESAEGDTINIEVNNTPEDAAADAATIEIHESEVEVVENENLADDIEETIEGMESLVAALEELAEANPEGISEETAKVIETAARIILKDDELVDAVVPSAESFRDNSATATTISVENIKESIKGGLNSMLEALKEFYRTVAQFLKNIFSSTGLYVKRARKIKEEGKGLASKKSSFTNKIAAQLEVDGTVPSSASGIVDVAKTFSTLMNAVLPAFSMADDTDIPLSMDAKYGIGSPIINGDDKGKKQVGDKLFAGRAPVRHFLVMDDDVSSLAMTIDTIGRLPPSSLEIPMPSGSEIATLMDLVEADMKTVNKWRRAWSIREKRLDAVMKEAKKETKEDKSISKSNGKKMIKALRTTIRGDKTFTGYAMFNAKLMMDYCSAAIKDSEKKAK